MNSKQSLKYIYIVCIAVLLSFSACVPVKDAINKDSNNRRHSQTTKTNNRHKSNNSKKETQYDASNSNGGGYDSSKLSNKETYKQSKAYLNSIDNRLSNYCLSWVGTSHKIGGTNKQGVDCSGFVQNVYKDVYNIQLPRRSVDMEKAVQAIDRGRLKEGDLVFFGKSSVNHVGIYLRDNNFIHTSTSKGVIVSSLEEKYWKQNFLHGGHHKDLK